VRWLRESDEYSAWIETPGFEDEWSYGKNASYVLAVPAPEETLETAHRILRAADVPQDVKTTFGRATQPP
jgi:hypothetical protein